MNGTPATAERLPGVPDVGPGARLGVSGDATAGGCAAVVTARALRAADGGVGGGGGSRGIDTVEAVLGAAVGNADGAGAVAGAGEVS